MTHQHLLLFMKSFALKHFFCTINKSINAIRFSEFLVSVFVIQRAELLPRTAPLYSTNYYKAVDNYCIKIQKI